MSKPKKPNRLGIRWILLDGFTYSEKCKQLASCPRGVDRALEYAFRSYLNHFLVDLPYSISLFELLSELAYWRIDGFSYMPTEDGFKVWLTPGRFEFDYINLF